MPRKGGPDLPVMAPVHRQILYNGVGNDRNPHLKQSGGTVRDRDCCEYDCEDPWEGVQLTKEAIRARSTLILYTALVSTPFVALVAYGGYLCGFQPHEVLGVSCYNAMISAIFFFDTFRNAAHECFDRAQAEGLVTCREGIPVVDPTYPHRRLARLSFAIGGREPRKRS